MNNSVIIFEENYEGEFEDKLNTLNPEDFMKWVHDQFESKGTLPGVYPRSIGMTDMEFRCGYHNRLTLVDGKEMYINNEDDPTAIGKEEIAEILMLVRSAYEWAE